MSNSQAQPSGQVTKWSVSSANCHSNKHLSSSPRDSRTNAPGVPAIIIEIARVSVGHAAVEPLVGAAELPELLLPELEPPPLVGLLELIGAPLVLVVTFSREWPQAADTMAMAMTM